MDITITSTLFSIALNVDSGVVAALVISPAVAYVTGRICDAFWQWRLSRYPQV